MAQFFNKTNIILQRRNSMPSLIIYFVLYLAVGAQQLLAQEFCSVVESNVTPQTVPITIDSPSQSFQQTSCVQFFQLNVSNVGSNRYLIFEVTFTSLPNNTSFMPLLISQNKLKPEVYINGSTSDNSTIDSNGLFNRKLYQNIVVDLQNISAGTSLYFAIYEYYPNRREYKAIPLAYTVKSRMSLKYLCPQDCSGNGNCDQQLQQCVCSSNQFDLDCSINGFFIPFDGSASQTVPSSSWRYFYIDARDYGSNVKLRASKNVGAVLLSFLFNGQNEYLIPNFYDYYGRYIFAPEVTDQTLRLPQAGFRSYDGGKFIIGAYNYEDYDISININISLFDKEEAATRNSIMYALIGIACILIVLWAIFTILKYRANRHALLVRRAQQIAASPLSAEELEKYFPKKNFSQFKSSFPQTLCSICLEDFQSETICRQLYCEHAYHDKCIEAWLANHSVINYCYLNLFLKNCPNCKKEMTRTAIEQFLNDPAAHNKEEKKPDLEEGHPLKDSISAQHKDLNNTLSNAQSPRKDIEHEVVMSPKIQIQEDVEISSNKDIKNGDLEVIELEKEKPIDILKFKDEKEAEELKQPVMISTRAEKIAPSGSKVLES